jgi:uncharacterized protein YcfJ
MVLLAGCAEQPYGPTVPVMPAQGKSMAAFQQDEAACEQYASDNVQGRIDRTNDKEAQNTVIGAILGTAVGAAVGNTKGAIVGGVAGGAIGNSSAHPGYRQAGIQGQYNMAYAQCMTSRGNTVEDRGPPRGYGPPPGYGSPPPPPSGY